jgi:hypothetical protein
LQHQHFRTPNVDLHEALLSVTLVAHETIECHRLDGNACIVLRELVICGVQRVYLKKGPSGSRRHYGL